MSTTRSQKTLICHHCGRWIHHLKRIWYFWVWGFGFVVALLLGLWGVCKIDKQRKLQGRQVGKWQLRALRESFSQSWWWHTLGLPSDVVLLGLRFWILNRVPVKGSQSWHLRREKGLGSHFLGRLHIHMKRYQRLCFEPFGHKLILKTNLRIEPRQRLQWF